MSLNYHHLHYFWSVARFGGVSAAARELHTGAATISTQIKQLEASLGHPLFIRRGKGMDLTEDGRTAFLYADRIFGLGLELTEALEGRSQMPLRVGVADVMPKLLVHHLLEPALDLDEPVRLVCEEGHPDELLAALAVHRLDLVLSDAPIPTHVDVRAYNHVLGECAIALFATSELGRTYGGDLPASLHEAPFLLPGPRTALRRALDHWFEDAGFSPHIVGEFDDGALLKVFGQAGRGVFAGPNAIADAICANYGLERIGIVEDRTERFFAITGERRLHHPVVKAICEAAKERIFV